MKHHAGKKTRDLREECLSVALTIVDEHGVEALSMREVARRLGVSHQAPYKHFASREHIVAEIIARAFSAFADYLDGRRQTASAQADMAEMGRCYLGYALAHPLNYRLMFGTPLPDPAAHPRMMEQARHAFALLHATIARVHGEMKRHVPKRQIDHDALFVWSTLHGLATILDGVAIQTLGLPKSVLAATPAESLKRIGIAMGLD